MSSRRIAFVLFWAFAFISPPAHALTAEKPSHNEVARFLAGLPLPARSHLDRWSADPAWKSHAAEFDRIWNRLDKGPLVRIRTWSKQHLETPRPTLFYMFSGPDFLYANAFFPEAQTYVMSGLEPIGAIPEITEGNRRALGRLRTALSTVVNLSFFKTIDMRSDFSGQTLGGTLPALFVFLARAGKTIDDVALVRVTRTGEIVAANDPAARQQPLGAHIKFSDSERKDQQLFYFQIDISNNGPHLAGYLEFCRKLGSGDAFVKSASYLMHSDSFSKVREFLLGNSLAIVQDDSGIPARHFASGDWQVIPFGRYLGPIPLFAGRYQRDLAEIYKRGAPRPLDFGIGYRYQQSESNLLLALRKAR